jgi:hypothetical protein
VSKHLSVTVHYPPAAKPYRDEHADRAQTIGQFKTQVLTAFGLTEGPQPDGTNATYTLYHHKTPLENMTETLGGLAGHEDDLSLKLAQQITQGNA